MPELKGIEGATGNYFKGLFNRNATSRKVNAHNPSQAVTALQNQ